MPLVHGFLILLGLQLLGDAISTGLALPIPGPVIGMIMLLLILIVKKGVPDDLGITADGLIKYIGLLFVPAGAGASLYLGLIAEQWLMIIVASFTSTVLTLVLCAWIFKALSKEQEK